MRVFDHTYIHVTVFDHSMKLTGLPHDVKYKRIHEMGLIMTNLILELSCTYIR